MTIEFLDKFTKELDRINQPHVKNAVLKAIQRVESAKALHEILHIKKLSGHKDAYRIKAGDYRIGIFVTGRLVQFARVVHRKDIYKTFP